MNIKKLLVGSMFSMLLGSEMAAADWGDVYYCQMTNSIGIRVEGEMERYKLEKFQFKLDQTKNAIIFGNKGFFANVVLGLEEMAFPAQEIWFASNEWSRLYFDNGDFIYSMTDIETVRLTVISADCNKF
jgi:hypothetical protein